MTERTNALEFIPSAPNNSRNFSKSLTSKSTLHSPPLSVGRNFLGRSDKEALLQQAGMVVWLYGLSGSGKSTLASMLERDLQASGKLCVVLDGDLLRSGITSDLGFSDDDRAENIRRVAHIARLFCQNGIIVLASFITPKEAFRNLAREIVGESDFLGVYLRCSFQSCAQRDVKGLYAKAAQNQITNFTGKDSQFEEPPLADLVIDTANETETESFSKLASTVKERLGISC